MALDRTFVAGEILSAGDVNGHLLGLWIPIDKRVITSGAPVSSVSFASIDSNFRIFRLTFCGIMTSAQIFTLRFNNDSGLNYNNQEFFAGAATVSAQRLTGQDAIRLAGGSAANEPVLGQYLIAKPTTASRAMVKGGAANFHTVESNDRAANWANVSALINRIDVLNTAAATFHGVFALEGMRGV